MKSRYLAKAKDSFKTKLSLFLFDHIIKGRLAFDKDYFKNFQITNDLVLLYTTIYWQQKRDFQIEGKAIDHIYHEMKQLRKEHSELIAELEHEYVHGSFSSIFPFPLFKELVSKSQCHYCGISLKEVDQLADKKLLFKKHERGWTLEIDRLNSNYEYRPENCVVACYWCNNAKTDEFTEDEFKEIGKSIKKVWEKRLQS